MKFKTVIDEPEVECILYRLKDKLGIGTPAPTETLDITGTFKVSSTADIGGAVTIGGATSITGDTNITGAVTVTGATSITGDTDVSGNLSSTGDFTCGGLSTCKKTEVALADADATLAVADLVKGVFTITPTAARTLTTDTAANIVAGITGAAVGTSFTFDLIVLAAYDVTVAGGTGVTVVGSGVVNNSSGTFRVVITNVTAGNEAVSIYRAA